MVPIAAIGTIPIKARERDRTADLLITNELLYQLSYPGINYVSLTEIIIFAIIICND